ncbi:hypothetical protein ES702_05689 [subsurface metagenome]
MRSKEEILEKLKNARGKLTVNGESEYKGRKDQLLLEILIDIRGQLEQLNLVIDNWARQPLT